MRMLTAGEDYDDLLARKTLQVTQNRLHRQSPEPGVSLHVQMSAIELHAIGDTPETSIDFLPLQRLMTTQHEHRHSPYFLQKKARLLNAQCKQCEHENDDVRGATEHHAEQTESFSPELAD